MSAHLETIEPSTASILGNHSPLRKVGRRLQWREIIFRATAVLATGLFVVRASVAVADSPGRITLLLIVLTESLSATLLLLSKVPRFRDTHPVALVCVAWAYLYAAAFGVDPGLSLVGPVAGTIVCCAGMSLTIWGKLAIGTSFGLLPAARPVVQSGPYRFIRHPIYVGYFITHAGFILSDFTVRNLAILVSLYLCQFVRTVREERVLRQEVSYRLYCQEVPYRFFPRLF